MFKRRQIQIHYSDQNGCVKLEDEILNNGHFEIKLPLTDHAAQLEKALGCLIFLVSLPPKFSDGPASAAILGVTSSGCIVTYSVVSKEPPSPPDTRNIPQVTL